MHRHRVAVMVVVVVLLHLVGPLSDGAAGEPDWMPLSDGTLAGWKKVGGEATYRVEGDSIVGQVGPGPNTFLRTERSFANFVLTLEMKIDVPGNSGIQLRSHQVGGTGQVVGYQVEIDPSARAWSGGIYDEGRRGWLDPLQDDPRARAAFRQADWNRYEIRAEGPWLRTWVNGVPCADLIDPVDAEGFIALQVHSGTQGQIRWRDVRIRELPATPWQPLWNGTDFEGWETIGGGQWQTEQGMIHGTSSAGETRHGHLISRARFSDFAVRLKYQAMAGNSGLYFRVDQGGWAGVQGFQAEIDPQRDAGGLYETDGRGWVVRPNPEDVKSWFRPGAWNEMSVVALGKRVVVQVNGKQTAELRDDPGRLAGHIALQLHGG
ncbi:MAG: hypothetical protein A2W31_09405, partial [Planctomycetes bacterium RBG_16_64_10]